MSNLILPALLKYFQISNRYAIKPKKPALVSCLIKKTLPVTLLLLFLLVASCKTCDCPAYTQISAKENSEMYSRPLHINHDELTSE